MSEVKCNESAIPGRIEPELYSGEPVFYHVPSGNRRCDGKPWNSRGKQYPVAEPVIEAHSTPAVEVSGILPLGTQLDVEVDESLRANQVRCSAKVYAALKEFLVVRRAVAKDLDEFVDRSIDAMNPKQLKQFSARREQLRKGRG